MYTPEYSEEEKLKRYKARVDWAEHAHERWRKDAEIYLTYYRNKNRVFTRGGQKVVVPSAIKNVDAMFAVLTAFEVVPVVVPKGLTPGNIAMVQDAALKNEWDEARVSEKAEDAIKDSLITKIGYLKVDYRYDEGEPEEVEASSPQMNPETGKTETPTEEEVEILEDRIVVEHVPWDEVYFDPEAKKWADLSWIAQKHIYPLEQLEQDDRFDTEGIEDGDMVTAWEDRPDDATMDEKRIAVYEVFDLHAGTRCWITASGSKILREAPNLFAQRLDLDKRNPFVAYITRTDPGNVPGISDVEAMKPAIDEANVLRSNLATFVDRMKPKMVAEEGAFTDQGKKAFKSQEWGEVVELRQGVPVNAVSPMQYPSLPQEMWAQDGKALQDADDVIGSNELVQGLLPAGRKTATAMQHMASASTVRQAEKRNRLERFYREIADRMLYLMKLMYDQDRIVRMVEDYGDVVWEFNAEDISFDVGISVELEPKQIRDTDTMREMGGVLLNILGNDPLVDQRELKKLVLIKYLKIPAEDVRMLLKSDEEVQAEQAAAAQTEAVMAQAGQGIPPAPEEIPGPVPGDALAQMVNADA